MLVSLLLAAAVAAPAPAHKVAPSGIVWMEDDLAGALARGKAERKLVFVDAWATWCHSCLSMQRYVLVDAGLRPVKDAVVWVAIETETEKNRDFTDKYPVEGLPTFLLIDPETGAVSGRWLGSSSVNEMRRFVHDGVEEWHALRKGARLSAAQAATREGNAAQQKGDKAAAAAAFRKAVAASGRADPARPERVGFLAGALHRLGTPEAARECLALAKAELPGSPSTAVGADLAITAAQCAEPLKADPLAVEVRGAAMARLQALADDAGAALSADDRSDLLANLAELHEERGDKEKAAAVMRQRAALLEDAAAKAPDGVMAATFDAHRTDTYLWLKELPKAEALLAAREKEMPDDYNPPARLARVLLEMKRAPEAEAAVERALAKMSKGPRRVGVLSLKARILGELGKSKEPVLREQLEVLRGLPATQRRPQTEKKLEEELKALGTKAGK